MAERTIELDKPVVTDEVADALREATDRAERAEAELAKLKAHSTAAPAPAATHAKTKSHAATDEGNLFEQGSTATEPTDAAAAKSAPAHSDPKDATAASAVSHKAETAGAPAGQAVDTEALKQPPTPSTARNAGSYRDDTAVTERGSADRATADDDGVDELRKDPMMAHLLESLDAGTDVGHYGRLVFAMVARHFLPHAQVIAWLTKDNDFNADQAQQMLHQVEGRDYNPPRRERLLQWQKEQEFQFMDVHDPDSGNLYRNLEFPKEVYDHIGHYQEAKSAE